MKPKTAYPKDHQTHLSDKPVYLLALQEKLNKASKKSIESHTRKLSEN